MTAGARAASVARLPQTPVQLYERLQAHGMDEAEMRRIRAACAVAVRLFAGAVQRCGRAQVQHCVGVAGGLLEHGAPADLIAAGLVHSAYLRGDFGAWRVLRSQRRAWLRAQLGERVEELVFAVDQLPWSPAAVRELPRRFETLNDLGRAAVWLRLCDELDGIASGGLDYDADAEQRHRELDEKLPALLELATRLGRPALGEAIARSAGERSHVPPALRFRGGWLLPPESAALRLDARLARGLAAAARRWRGAHGS